MVGDDSNDPPRAAAVTERIDLRPARPSLWQELRGIVAFIARQVLGVSLCRSFPRDVNAGVAAAMSSLHPCLAAVTHPQRRVARFCPAQGVAGVYNNAKVHSCVAWWTRGLGQATRGFEAASPGDAGVTIPRALGRCARRPQSNISCTRNGWIHLAWSFATFVVLT
jgi:hypothetical protein